MLTTTIPELFGVQITKDNEADLLMAAQDAGWQQSGLGHFSIVFVRGNQALKIFNDPAYMDFLTQIVTPHNSAFPIVLAGPFVGAGLSAVILERLEPLADADLWLSSSIVDATDNALCLGEFDSDSDEAYALSSHIGDDGVAALDLIVGLALAFGLGTDLQPTNMMRRPGTDQLVFTDPLKI